MWIENVFLPNRQLQTVTACPLYAYYCTDIEFAALQIELQRCANGPAIGKRTVGALFCLFATEWWRRNYQGGRWRWESLLTEANLHFGLQERYELVELGLRFWQRPLLQLSGKRGFLVTLACEGGLPLQLLHQDNTHLYRYFKELLRRKQLFQTIACKQLASELRDYLPHSLHQDMVFELSGQLIDAILELQKTLINEDIENPLETLDAIKPEWRKHIPLNLDDELAKHFLNGLVIDAIRHRQHAVSQLTLKRYLKKQADHWVVCAEINIPPSISVQDLYELARQPLPNRFELSLLLPDKTQISLAHVSQRDTETYLLESRKRIQFMFGMQSIGQFFLLFQKSLNVLTQVNLKGGEVLNQLPWIFIDKQGTEERLEFVGSGSANLCYEIAWVAHPENNLVEFTDCVEEPIENLKEINRNLYRLEGQGYFMTEASDLCVINTAQPQDTANQYVLSGKTLDYKFLCESIYIDLPSLSVYSDQTRLRIIPTNQLSWKNSHAQDWQPLSQHCLGQGQLAWLEKNELKFLTKIAILPANFTVNIQQGCLHNEGTLVLEGISNVQLGWDRAIDQQQGIERIQEQQGASIYIHCVATQQPPVSLNFSFRWQRNQQLYLSLPFPIKKGYLIDGEDKILQPRSLISIEKLSGIRAIIINPKGRYQLTAKLNTTSAIPRELAKILCFQINVPNLQADYCEFSLFALKANFASLLSAVDDLDAHVDVRIEGMQGMTACIHICHYDLSLQIQNDTVSLLGGLVNVENLQQLSCYIQPLWKPEQEPQALVFTENAWNVETNNLETGPWLITLHDGQWLRGRPELFPVTSNTVYSTELSQLQHIIYLSNSQQREQELSELCAELATNPNHLDWELILSYFKNFSEFPASSIDVFKAVAKNHEMAVLLLLKTSDAIQFTGTWNLLKQLPFSWLLIPLDTWSKVVFNFIQELKTALATMPKDMQQSCIDGTLHSFLENLKNHHSADEIIKEWIHREQNGFLQREDRYLSLVTTPQGNQVYQSQLEQACQDLLRNHASDDDEWPNARFLRQWKVQYLANLPAQTGAIFLQANLPHREAIQDAPIITALSCAFALPIDATTLYEIRHLRLFDSDWFDEAYLLALTLATGIRLNEGN